jgi:hypothetical protein
MYGEDTGKIIERLKGVLEDIKKYTTLLKSGCSAPDEIYSTYESGDGETPLYKSNAPSLKNNIDNLN